MSRAVLFHAKPTGVLILIGRSSSLSPFPGKLFDRVRPECWLGRLGDQFQVANHLPLGGTAAPHGLGGGSSVAGSVGILGGSCPRNTSSAITSASLRVSPTMGSLAQTNASRVGWRLQADSTKANRCLRAQLCRVVEQKAVDHRLRSSSIVRRRMSPPSNQGFKGISSFFASPLRLKSRFFKA